MTFYELVYGSVVTVSAVTSTAQVNPTVAVTTNAAGTQWYVTIGS